MEDFKSLFHSFTNTFRSKKKKKKTKLVLKLKFAKAQTFNQNDKTCTCSNKCVSDFKQTTKNQWIFTNNKSLFFNPAFYCGPTIQNKFTCFKKFSLKYRMLKWWSTSDKAGSLGSLNQIFRFWNKCSQIWDKLTGLEKTFIYQIKILLFLHPQQ